MIIKMKCTHMRQSLNHKESTIVYGYCFSTGTECTDTLHIRGAKDQYTVGFTYEIEVTPSTVPLP